jgi:hypothetical protein
MGHTHKNDKNDKKRQKIKIKKQGNPLVFYLSFYWKDFFAAAYSEIKIEDLG